MSRDRDLDDVVADELAQDLGPEPATEEEERREGGRTSRMLRMAKKLMDRKELTQDGRDLLFSVLATSDKAKTEAVKMVAREVRNYLEALELKEDMLRIMTSYSLEVSIKLKPLADAVAAEDRKEEEPS